MARYTGDSTQGATTASATPDGPLWTSAADREQLGLSAEQLGAIQRALSTGSGGTPEMPDRQDMNVGGLALVGAVLVLLWAVLSG